MIDKEYIEKRLCEDYDEVREYPKVVLVGHAMRLKIDSWVKTIEQHLIHAYHEKNQENINHYQELKQFIYDKLKDDNFEFTEIYKQDFKDE